MALNIDSPMSKHRVEGITSEERPGRSSREEKEGLVARFEHGGSVELLTNADRTLAVASRYEE